MEIYSIMKIDGIAGDGPTNPLITDKVYRDWIEVQQYSIGMHMPESQESGAEKASFNDLFIKKYPDKASQHLAMACTSGRKIKSITIDFYNINNNKKIRKYAVYKFKDAMVSSWYQNSMTVNKIEPEQSPIEQVAFNYSKIEFNYLSGQPTPEKTMGFDLKSNKPY
jgi:type VI secretion system Hcp family effector